MCEAKVYVEQGESREPVMEDVVTIEPKDDGLKLVNLFGEVKTIPAKIKEIKLLEHVVLLEPTE